jgi:hypothetical protein
MWGNRLPCLMAQTAYRVWGRHRIPWLREDSGPQSPAIGLALALLMTFAPGPGLTSHLQRRQPP